MNTDKKERQTYLAQDGKTYAFKEKNTNCRFVFGGTPKVWTAETAIKSPEAMERLIKSNDKKIEVVKVASKATAKPKAKASTEKTTEEVTDQATEEGTEKGAE
jgi:hypothetical protein